MNSSPALILLGGALGGMLIGDGLKGTFLKYAPYIHLYVDGVIQMWTPTVVDLLSIDWEIIES